MARPPASRPAASGHWQLFLVERRLLEVSAPQLAVLQAALSGAAARFSARGEHVRYLRSIFLTRQGRLISLFTAEGTGAVRAVNEAALIPFTSIEPAVDLPGSGQP
jgi:hypothetical protein